MEGRLLRLWLRNRTGVEVVVGFDGFGGDLGDFGFLLFCLEFEVLWV